LRFVRLFDVTQRRDHVQLRTDFQALNLIARTQVRLEGSRLPPILQRMTMNPFGIVQAAMTLVEAVVELAVA